MRLSPRVRCESCDFAWYGATAAHGLSVVGTCPRCGGSLHFLAESDAGAPEVTEHLEGVDPASVLGNPTTWAR